MSRHVGYKRYIHRNVATVKLLGGGGWNIKADSSALLLVFEYDFSIVKKHGYKFN